MSDVRQSGYLAVDSGHEIYYELLGNPKGPPVVFLHGGPGAGFADLDKIPFDFSKHNVLFFDQRGAGRSKYQDIFSNNTTEHLLMDIDSLTAYLGFDKFILYGGSWGTTLALVYAIGQPDKVMGMILRGIFTSLSCEYTNLFIDGASRFFPERHERFISLVPPGKQSDPLSYYFEKIQQSDKDTRDKYIYEYALYEMSLAKLDLPVQQVEQLMAQYSVESISLLGLHYLSQNCFLPENYIWDNINVIQHIPTYLVHGRYDVICMPKIAHRLNKALKTSVLEFVIAGHSASEAQIQQALGRGLYWMEQHKI